MKRNAILFLFLFPFLLQATIIIPPDSFGEMLNNSDLVVYCTITGHLDNNPYQNNIKVLKLIKGELKSYEKVVIDEYGQKVGDWVNVISGDTNFRINENYLVFLTKKDNGHYQARLMALSVFIQEKIDGKDVFIHESGLKQIAIVNTDTSIELEDMFSVEKFINHLSDIAINNISWDAIAAGQLFLQATIDNETNNPIPLVLGDCPNPKPSHCTVLSGNPAVLDGNCNTFSPARFPLNVWTAYIAGGASSDTSTSTEIVDVQNAVTRLDGMPGINITYGGIDPAFGTAQITCSPKLSNDRINFGGGHNDIYIFFNDPCNEITDLSGCSGTVGRGGNWNFGSCTSDICGNQWHNARYPFFLFNNGAGCVSAGKYTAIAIHEMLHSMGFGHTSGSCSAVMNPSICNSPAPSAPDFGVTSLDEDCTDWMYNITVVPVDLLRFTAELDHENVEINWATASEINNDFFQIERSRDNTNWEVIDEVKGAGNSNKLIDYTAIDTKPLKNTSYYRLKQKDFDGTINYSDIVTIENSSRSSNISIAPNPFKEEFVINGLFESKNTSIEVFDIKGALKYSVNIQKGQHNLPINIDNLDAGIFIVKISSSSVQKTIKLVKF